MASKYNDNEVQRMYFMSTKNWHNQLHNMLRSIFGCPNKKPMPHLTAHNLLFDPLGITVFNF